MASSSAAGDLEHTAGLLTGAATIDLRLTIDLDKKTVDGELTGPVPLRRIAENIGGTGQWVLEWVPDVEFDSFAVGYDPKKKAFALAAQGGTSGASAPQASLVVGFVEQPDGTRPWLVEIDLDATVDLGGVPVIGSVLSGTSIGPLAVEYATGDIPANALPAPAPAGLAEVKPGLSLGVTLTAAGATYPLSYNHKPQQQAAGRPPAPELLARLTAPSPPAAPDPGAAAFVWFDVGRTFGPLEVGRIGIESNPTDMGLGFDASLALSVLSIGLTGFQISFKKSDFRDFQLAIDGLAIAIDSPSLTVQGGLIRSLGDPDAKPPTCDSYDGAVVIKAGGYGITAIGSFTQVDGAPSMFVFGVALGTFGGPPAFFVTGLAAGFGFNRGLKLPTIDQVATFPFVELVQGSSSGGAPDTATVLEQLGTQGWIAPQQGEYWLAAGIQATSFGIARSLALLTVEFGSELVFAILGTSVIQLPVGGGSTYAKATLQLEAVLRPAEGTFQLSALLTPDSYVIDPACQLTGGFAFWLWFGDNPHSGDFVVSLGGYNPHFTPPAWYPMLPQLGFNWRMSDQLQLTGGAYFALTPSCVMAGGSLSLTYGDGGLSAWFDAYADFILWWHPFYYDIEIGVSIGASYSTHVLGVHVTFSVSLSADVQLWGPEMAGVAHVNWWVIGFTININGGGSPTLPASVLKYWSTFEQTFLPQPQQTSLTPPAPAGSTAGAAEGAPTPVLVVRPAGGLIGQVHIAAGNDWLMTASGFSLATQSAIPATEAQVIGPKGPTATFDGPQFGVYPLGLAPAAPGSSGFTSIQTLTITSVSTQQALDTTDWTWSPVVTGLPASLWGIENDGTAALGASTTPGLIGLVGTARAPAPIGPGSFEVALLGLEEAYLWLALSAGAPTDGSVAQPSGDTRPRVGPSGSGTVADPATQAVRTGVVAALNAAYGAGTLPDDGLATLAQKVDLAYLWGPMIGPLGTSGGPPVASAGIGVGGAPEPRAAVAGAARGPHPPRVVALAIFRRVAPAVQRTDDATGSRAGEVQARWQRVPRSRVFAHAADRQAATKERRVLESAHRDDGSVRLVPGATIVWRANPDAVLRLEGDGALALRLTVVDRGGNVLCDTLLDGGPPFARNLPVGAARVALSCAGEPLRVLGVAGWHGESPLAQLGPFALLGEGCVVRGQAPHRITHRRRRGTREVGVATGRTLVERCWTTGSGGRERGFLQTTLPATTRTVVLSLRPDATMPVGAELAPAASCASASDPVHGELALAGSIERAGRSHLVYALAGARGAANATGGALVRAITHADAGWVQDGVLGFTCDASAVLGGSDGPCLGHATLGRIGDRSETAVRLR